VYRKQQDSGGRRSVDGGFSFTRVHGTFSSEHLGAQALFMYSQDTQGVMYFSDMQYTTGIYLIERERESILGNLQTLKYNTFRNTYPT
jgi:S-ribosylhomocysteine lyase LuxS involved in autoinducer biosynthesis